MSRTDRDRRLEAEADGVENVGRVYLDDEPPPPPPPAEPPAWLNNGGPAVDAVVEHPVEPDDERRALQAVVASRAARSLHSGGRFIFDTPAAVEAVWGGGEQVLWAQGEPAMLCGPSGVGKTTIAQQVTLARLGLRGDVLGFRVEPSARRVLYLALDRPRQVARSFARMVTQEPDAAHLDAHLTIWRGPLPLDIAREPQLLAAMAEWVDAGTIIVDSVKDTSAKLTDDESGANINRAHQYCLEVDCELLVLHHQRKAQAGAGKPKTLSDVYGSVWLTAGMGSVLLVWGEPGDAIVTIEHLKQPAENVGPLSVLHDHAAGHSTVEEGADLYEACRRSQRGLTAEGAARAMFAKAEPARNEVERARRRLESMVGAGVLHPERGGKDPGGKQLPTQYFAVVKEP